MGDEENDTKKNALASLLGDDDEDEGVSTTEKFLNTQFDPESRIIAIERLLKGEKWNGEEWIVPTGITPLCNTQGVFILISKIRSLINPDSVNGYMTEDQYNELMIEFNFELVRVINRERVYLGIKRGMTKFIIDMIDHRVRTFLSGSIEGRRAILLTHILAKKNIESSNKQIQQKSIMNALIN